MKPKSSTLFHFTKSLDFLKNILSNGFYPRYCLEDTEYLGIDYVAYPMVCFCDIPISRISDHTAFYGEYGLGMTKEWGLKNKICPIIYTPSTGVISDLANFLLDVDLRSTKEKSKKIQDQLDYHFNQIIPLIKPLNGNMVIKGKPVEKEFYQENEWRYVPDTFEMLFQDDEEFKFNLKDSNKEMEKYVLKFTPYDIKYIFLKSDAEIPAIFDFIQNNLGHFSLNDIKILSTRITSIETITKDI